MAITDMAGHADPLNGHRRPSRPGTRRARPLRAADARKVIAACPDTPAGRRDAALVATMCAGLLRGIEAARATWADLAADPDQPGAAWLELGAHKTDPRGVRRHRAWLPAGAVRRIEAMRPDAGDDPRLFRLSAGPDGDDSGQVALRVRLAGRRAGIEGLSGHSPRRGAAHDLLDSGASIIELMRAGRWTTLTSAERYVAELTRAGGRVELAAVLDPDHRPPEPEPPPAPWTPRSRGYRRVLERAGAL